MISFQKLNVLNLDRHFLKWQHSGLNYFTTPVQSFIDSLSASILSIGLNKLWCIPGSVCVSLGGNVYVDRNVCIQFY